ncbi:MAG: cyanophycinase [Parvularculaceae bacterium]|nr:cyanophycinase [Parvularculaceae bacterium]
MLPLSPSSRGRSNPNLKFAIIGGRLEDDNRQVYREMRRLSGGKILVFPTASSVPDEVGEEQVDVFRMHGFETELMMVTDENYRDTAFDPAMIKKVEEYGSVYFTGGDQSKLLAALKPGGKETPLLKAIRTAHKNGGLLAGSSAGAAMMSVPMIVGGTSYEAMFHGYTEDADEPGLLLGKGLGFFPYGLVDQHVIKRGRLARMVVALSHTRTKRAFGVDENTAMIIDGKHGQVVGEYGVFFIDAREAKLNPADNTFDNVRLSYVDDGDEFTLPGFTVQPAESKRRVRKTEIAYRAPARSHRNAFGAYALYDLIARLVLGDQASYSSDSLLATDPKTSRVARATVTRKKGVSRCLVSTPADGLRMTALRMRLSLEVDEQLSTGVESGDDRSARSLGMDLNERSRIILLGSSPLYTEPQDQKDFLRTLGDGPVGVLAAASAEAKRTAGEHVQFFKDHGIDAIDLGITIDNVDYAAKDTDLLDRIEDMRTIFLCGGNQIRLVETLLHRGEESAVLRAIASAYSHGATIVASSGAVSALSRLMIAGGSSYEAMRYGVASDLGHQGLVIQEGLGLLKAGVADQNLISGRRLGRLISACAEENEAFGVGVCDESAVIATKSSRELTAAGRHGFVLVDTSSSDMRQGQDGFVAKDVRVRMFAPGDRVNLTTGHIERASDPARSSDLFERMISDVMREGIDLDDDKADHSDRHAIRIRLRREETLTAMLDLECSREEHDD